MALASADAEAVVAECETLFIILGNDGLEEGEGQVPVVLLGLGEEFVYVCPALGVEFKFDQSGLVTEDKA